MLLVIDTNIIVNALKSPSRYDEHGNRLLSKSQELIVSILNGTNRIILSPAVAREYEEVLHRPQLGLDALYVDKFLFNLMAIAIWITPKPTNPEQVDMPDEDDRIFFDLAKCSHAKLVTRNLKHFPIHELRTSIDEIIP